MNIVIERRYSPSAGKIIGIPIMHTKYIYFEKETDYKGKTERWVVCSNQSHEPLGLIEWHGAWRQYVFEPEDGCIIFNNSCLKTIMDFLTDLNAKQKLEYMKSKYREK